MEVLKTHQLCLWWGGPKRAKLLPGDNFKEIKIQKDSETIPAEILKEKCPQCRATVRLGCQGEQSMALSVI
jgi:hypothetical protein